MMLGLLCVALLGQAAEAPRLPPAAEQRALRATVRVHNRARGEVGTGVVIGRVGPAVYILTAAHVVHGAEQVEVQLFDSGKKQAAAHVLKDVSVVARTSSAVEDLALLRVAAGGDFASAELRKEKAPAVKTPSTAFSVGFTGGDACTVTAETIVGAPLVRKPGADDSAQFWRCRVVPVAGRSGGPLLDATGRLLGICSGGDAKAGYYTHLDEIRRFLTRNGLRFLAQ